MKKNDATEMTVSSPAELHNEIAAVKLGGRREVFCPVRRQK